MKKIKKRIIVISILIITAITGLTLSFFVFKNKEEEKKRIEKEKLVELIKNNYSSKIMVTKDSNLYKRKNNKYEKVGTIKKGEILFLKKVNINDKTRYFPIADTDLYISYKDCSVTESNKVLNNRYLNYLPFNENVVSKENVNLYRNGEIIYTLNYDIDRPIIMKDDMGYYVEMFKELYFINKEDVLKTYEVVNSELEEAVDVPVTVYHFIYLEGDTSCNEMICHHENQIREEFQYLKDNNYFTLNTTELRLFIEGKLRLPKNSILVTIDDGARAENFIPIMEEYNINMTLFLISSWYPKDKFKSDLMEVASHTNDLHWPGRCPGGQGSPLKCENREKLLEDLRKSREALDGTEAFCFPFYEYNDYAINIIKDAGFKMAFVGGVRKANRGTDLFKIPRITMHRGTTLNEYINYIK